MIFNAIPHLFGDDLLAVCGSKPFRLVLTKNSMMQTDIKERQVMRMIVSVFFSLAWSWSSSTLSRQHLSTANITRPITNKIRVIHVGMSTIWVRSSGNDRIHTGVSIFNDTSILFSHP